MITVTKKSHLHATDEVVIDISLSYDQRQKSRIKTNSECGVEVGVILDRGDQLFHGDILANDSGNKVRVIAQDEDVVEVSGKSGLDIVKAAYHLGNRHVPVQIAEQHLWFKRDHVLEEMLAGLGLTTKHVSAPFQPESGAYHTHQKSHHHEH